MLCVMMFAATAMACGDKDPEPEWQPTSDTIQVVIGDRTFNATIAGSEAGRAFIKRLPLTLHMSDLNGNEKYADLDAELPTDSHRPGAIESGDLMLYGSKCVVLFYKTFSSSYSYTRLGRITDTDGLTEAVGSGSVTVTFQKND